MLSKKYYIAIANILKSWTILEPVDSFDRYRNVIIANLITDLIQFFKSDNPNFDEQKFRDACK